MMILPKMRRLNIDVQMQHYYMDNAKKNSSQLKNLNP